MDGVILGSAPRDLSSQFFRGDLSYGYTIRRVLEDAANDQNVKGVLLHLQTPGGTIYGARAIHDGVLAFKRTAKRPVIAFIEGLSASGGVMAMVGADKIYADHGSFIGSIGVLGPQILYYNKPIATDGGLLGGGITTREGIEQTIVTAGRGKDLGNPFRAPTAEEVQVLQGGVDTEYAHFVKHVSTFRKIDENVIRNDMGAHIFDNEKAQAFGLIDGTLDRNATIERLAESAKLGKDYQLVRPRGEQGSFWAQFVNQQCAVGRESRSQDGRAARAPSGAVRGGGDASARLLRRAVEAVRAVSPDGAVSRRRPAA